MLFPGNSRWNPYLALGDKSSSEMTVRRNRFASVPPGYFSSTKGHSAIRKWSNYPASRAAVYAEDIHWPEYIRPLRSYDTTREENEIRRDVSSELIYTTNLMDDTYDVAAKSRNRDQALLRDANRALPSLNKYGNQVADRKTTGSLTSTRRFQIPRSPKLISPNLQRGPTIYPKLAPPMYKATTSVQPLGILTQLDWTSPLEKFSTPRRLPELTNEDDSSEISRYETPVQSARSSPERDFGTKPKRYKVRSKQKPMIGNYYRRHVHRPGRSVQYYPYLDNDSVASDNIGEVLSNGEYLDDNDYQTVTDAGDGEYYIVNRGRSPSPTPSLDYVPFGPRSKINFDSDDYKCQVPSMSDLVMSNYTSHEKDTNVDSEGSRIKHDLVFHDIVAHTAAKARDALTNVDLDEYDNASLVISVEGEYKDPVKGENLGFHYIARPLQLKGPMLAGPAMYASRASDSAFIRYMDDMRSFRAQIRNRLETGYKTLSEITSKYQSHSYPVIASSHRSFSKALSPPRSSSPIPRSSSPVRSYSAHSLPISNLRKRLEEIENKYRSRYGKRLDESLPDRLVVYPISEKGTVRSVTEMEGLPGHTKTVELYQGTAKTNELSTLEKINIKAALVGNKVEVLTPHRRRPKSTYAANKLRQLRREEREIETEAVPAQVTTGLKATTVTPNYIDGGKAHWDGEGNITQPKNLMSWKYRIQARVPPGDYYFPLKTIGTIRDKLLHVKEDMDRHKQLMDRYLPNEESGTDVKTKIMNMYVDMEQKSPYLFRGKEGLLSTQSSPNSSSSYTRSPTPRRAVSVTPSPVKSSEGYQPMSDVRRRVRRVICKNRGNPRFFKTD